jgi:hypothetical protein
MYFRKCLEGGILSKGAEDESVQVDVDLALSSSSHGGT